jgi:hypothetical protein
MLWPQPIAAHVSANATTAGANKNPGPCDEGRRDVNMSDDEVPGGVVEHAAELAWNQWPEELCGAACVGGRLRVVQVLPAHDEERYDG